MAALAPTEPFCFCTIEHNVSTRTNQREGTAEVLMASQIRPRSFRRHISELF